MGARSVLKTPPYSGSLPTAVPIDPYLSFYALVSVCGTTFKELVCDWFGRSLAMES
jgi:cyanate lyase